MDWQQAQEKIRMLAQAEGDRLTAGQRASLWAVGERLGGGAHRGLIIADDVGMGKTRVATAVAAAVVEAGGRVAIVVPPGLRYQWQAELKGDGLPPPPFLHTLDRLLGVNPDSPDDPARSAIVLASHGFSNWRMGPDTHASRWGLLPVLIGLLARDERGRAPQGFDAFKDTLRNFTALRAEATYQRMKEQGDTTGLNFLRDLADGLAWEQRFCQPGAYTRGSGNRWRLERAIGLSLGRFDLVIIDEAHKSRAEEGVANEDTPNTGSGLSRLLTNVLQLGLHPARIALTATPLALSPAQWLGTLKRIGTPPSETEAIAGYISRYVSATEALRGRWRTDPPKVDAWIEAAKGFEAALAPYVIRRDKSEVRAIRDFRERTGGNLDYRRFSREVIAAHDLSQNWRNVILAAEGLSAAVSGTADPKGKRLRTTLASGHGIASHVDEALQGESTESSATVPLPIGESSPYEVKRSQRAALWRRMIVEQTGARRLGVHALYDHPLVLTAVSAIEGDLKAGHKVLVFGRFTAGMTALHDLLNARAKLTAATGSGLWPAEFLGLGEVDDEGNERTPLAVDLAAARQLGIHASDFPKIVSEHRRRWDEDRNQRRWWADHALDVLAEAARDEPRASSLVVLLEAARADTGPVTAEGRAGVGALVARAVRELMPEDDRTALNKDRMSPSVKRAALLAFNELVSAALDADQLSEEDEDDIGDQGTDWALVRDHLIEAFSAGKSTLARLLQGSTRYPTRRLLQAAFNRLHSYPSVLIAQSMVGREGLNLHAACSVMLQFHPEWNPGVVEQQIGRVDRYGSRWQRDFERTPPNTPVEALPRIEVRSLVFGGTYDEHHWRVLDARHRELRAHLHGEVLLAQEAEGDPDALAIVERVNQAAPRFTPPRVPELRGFKE